MGICINCFYDKVNGDVCPQCHFDVRTARTNLLMLRPFTTLLNGRYLIGRILGAGGFGITYKAYDNENKRVCAIKEYAPLNVAVRQDGITMTEDGPEKRKIYYHCKKRFYEEAESLYKCRGIPQIVTLEAYFEENNTAYFSMEYIGDRNLKGLMSERGGKVPINDLMNIMIDVGCGLERAHNEVNIFHRDISPENIMLGNDGRTVKLIDFGSAKFIAKNEAERSSLTVMLKPGYAPLEQYTSTSRQGTFTDVYAMAATFYHAASGTKLPNATDRSMGEKYIKLKDMGIPGVTEKISDCLDHALALRADERTQTVGEFVRELMTDKDGTRNIPAKPFLPDDKREETVVGKPQKLGRPFLRVVKGEGVGTKWYLPIDDAVIIGRMGMNADVIVTVTDTEISREHCRLQYEPSRKRFWIRDLNSQNGTMANGLDIKSDRTYSIAEGSKIVLGADTMELEVGIE